MSGAPCGALMEEMIVKLYMRTRIRLLVLLGATVMLCAACGYKGPLYLPSAEPAATKAVMPTAK